MIWANEEEGGKKEGRGREGGRGRLKDDREA